MNLKILFKIELYCYLDGSFRLEIIIDIVNKECIDIFLIDVNYI